MNCCRVCGCSMLDPCIDVETGETCGWSVPGLCTFCAELDTDLADSLRRGFLEPGSDEPLVELASEADADRLIRELRHGA